MHLSAKLRRYFWLALILMIFVIVSGSGNTSTAQQLQQTQPVSEQSAQEFRQNLRLWTQQDIVNYRYTLSVSCFCLTEVTQPVIVEVRNAEFASVVAAESGQPVNPEFFQEYNSIRKLFEVIQDAIDQKADYLLVNYDPNLGYPTQINIDYSAQIADEEKFLTIENLEAIE
ncbi:DUF6174 domain-containing protein [Lyngbya aestuarii]|uniref:DUF6174 domain-containing protein n=1 Tax=Lyngbya aestuarii TaxID=118322 RepID=UPI00403DEE52